MSAIVDALRLKTERAEKHRLDFKAAIGEGVEPPRRFTANFFHTHKDWYPEFTSDLVEPGPEVGIIVGDVVHQLRSCLDHLMCQLVFDRTKNPADREQTQFPIFESEPKFHDHKLYGFLRHRLGDSSPEFTAINESQPYERYAGTPMNDPLYFIAKLDNIDKHRAILVLAPTISYEGFVFLKDGPVHFSKRKQPIKPGANLLDIGMTLPDPPPRVQMEGVALHVVFADTDGVCDNLSVYPIMRNMIDAVNEIITKFERFFL